MDKIVELIKKPWFNFVIVIFFVAFLQNCFKPKENYGNGAMGPDSLSSGNSAYASGDPHQRRVNMAYLHQIGW